MPKSNNEILQEYKTRFYNAVEPLLNEAVHGKPSDISKADLLVMVEAIHIVDRFLADPSASLMQTKLAYDVKDYTGKWNHDELFKKISDTTTFFNRWEPGALFV